MGNYISLQLEKASWGEKTIGELAVYIKKHHPEIKGFDRSGLYRMRQFYEIYANTVIVAPVVTQLETADLGLLIKINWTHHLIIMSSCKTEEEREFYIRLCIRERYSKRELERQINSGVFERTMLGTQLSPSATEIAYAV